MKIIIEDGNGKDLCSFDVFVRKLPSGNSLPINHTISKLRDCGIAVVDEANGDTMSQVVRIKIKQ